MSQSAPPHVWRIETIYKKVYTHPSQLNYDAERSISYTQFMHTKHIPANDPIIQLFIYRPMWLFQKYIYVEREYLYVTKIIIFRPS